MYHFDDASCFIEDYHSRHGREVRVINNIVISFIIELNNNDGDDDDFNNDIFILYFLFVYY